MSSIVKLSEAASIGLHAMFLLAENDDNQMSVKEISDILGVSDHHLSKVLQRLTREGIVKSVRGPKGGFSLAKKPTDISLLQVYEIIEGPMSIEKCLLGHPDCTRPECRIGSFFDYLNSQVRDYMKNTTLAPGK